MIELKLSAYQQDALAELASVISRVKRRMEQAPQYTSPESQAAREQMTSDDIEQTIERFERINWGELYDKLHRTGANS